MGHIPFTYFLLILLAWCEVLIALITDKMIIAEIINSYFTNSLKTLITSDDVDRFRKKLYSFQDIIGTTANYFFFNNYYIQMMEKLDSRYDSLSDYLDDNNIYLIPKKENKFTKIINYVKKLIWKKESVR